MTISDELDKLVEKQTLQEAKIEYAINTMQDLAKQWRDADYDLRVRFQSMVFPEGDTIDMATMQFGTEKISPLYRYIPNKKDLSISEKSLLVTLPGILGYIFVALRKVNFSALLLAIEPFGFSSRARAIK